MVDHHTARLAIEPLRRDHAEELFGALDHPAVSTHFEDPEVTTLEALRERIERLLVGAPPERWLNWVVRSAEDPDRPVIGRLEATTYGEWGEVAYVFDPRVWGRGYATEATRWLLDRLAAEDVRELWACIAPANQPSIRLVERLGFTRVDGVPPRPLGSWEDSDVAYRLILGPPA